MIPIETIPGIKGGVMGDRSGGGNSSIYLIIHCKNHCKCYNVSTPGTEIINR
jgi:hypothetical protein